MNTGIHKFYITARFPLPIGLPFSTYMSLKSLHTDLTLHHISVKKQNTTLINDALDIYVSETDIHLQCHILASCTNYSMCINGEVFQYICHIQTGRHQPFGKDCCSQMMMLMVATMVMIQPDCIS